MVQMVSDTQSKRSKQRSGKTSSNVKRDSLAQGPYKHTSTIFEAHKQAVYGAAFNPYLDDPEMGAWLATCGSRYLTIYRLFAHEKRIEAMIQFADPNKEEGYYAVAWAIDEIKERHVVVVGGAKGIIRVIDPLRKETCNTLRGHGEAVNEIRTSPASAQIVASASKDRTVRLWNVRDAACLAIFGGAHGHLDEVISLDFDPAAHFIASSSMDHTVRVWDIRPESRTGKRVEHSLNEESTRSEAAEENHFPLALSRDVHTNYVDCTRFVGNFILTKASLEAIILWKFGAFDAGAAGEGTLLRTESYVLQCGFMMLPNADAWFIKFDIHPSNKYLACGNEVGDVHLWRLERADKFFKHESNHVISSPDCKACIRQTAFSPCGRILIAVGELGAISRFDWTATE